MSFTTCWPFASPIAFRQRSLFQSVHQFPCGSMICVFKSDFTCASPRKKARRQQEVSLAPEDENAIYEIFDYLHESLPRRHRAEVVEHIMGVNGIALVETATQSLATDSKRGITCYFKGNTDHLAEVEETGAEFFLKQYLEEGTMVEESKMLQKLAALKTPYAFVIYDHGLGQIFAARDAEGEENLFWGTNACNGGLLFASDRHLIESCADADFFPAGALFISGVGDTAGNLTDIPVMSAKAKEVEDAVDEVYRSLSRTDLAGLGGGMGSRVPSQNQIAAN